MYTSDECALTDGRKCRRAPIILLDVGQVFPHARGSPTRVWLQVEGDADGARVVEVGRDGLGSFQDGGDDAICRHALRIGGRGAGGLAPPGDGGYVDPRVTIYTCIVSWRRAVEVENDV